jgi:NDP-mannose synthase
MQAIILAGGKGARLKPYTVVFPKPMVPIGDYPILEIVIRQLKYFGFTDITLAVGHLKELLQAFFDNGSRWNVKISYSMEDKPLGTAAPLRLVKNVENDFLVMNGDILTNLDYRNFFEYHRKNNALCTIASYSKQVKIDLGILEADQDNQLRNYIEKPALHYNVSMGVYAFKKEALDFIPENRYFDFPDLIKTLLANGKKVLQYPFDGYWLDIGRPEDYERAADEFEKCKSEFLRDLQ